MSEVDVEIVKTTQKSLGRYVKKPVLTEKLLSKPPFRFLHDVVLTVIKNTGFLKDLFGPHELNPDNVKDREAKLAFLNKLIDAVKTVTKIDLKVRASKVIAGVQVNETNLLLQAIAHGIEKKIDTSEYVKKLKNDTKDSGEKAGKVQEKKSKTTRKTSDDKKSNSGTEIKKTKKTIKSPKDNIDGANSEKPTSSLESAEETATVELLNTISANVELQNETETQSVRGEEESVDERPKTRDVHNGYLAKLNTADSEQVEKEKVDDIKPNSGDEEKPIAVHRLASARPKSARPRSGNEKQESEHRAENATISPPKTHLRPPSVRPSSARPGAPRLRPDSSLPMEEIIPTKNGKIKVIVDNFNDKNEPEEDIASATIVLQDFMENPNNNESEVSTNNQSHLVEQILDQIKDGNSVEQTTRETENIQGRGAISEEMSVLRNLIQNITKTANPFGKLLNYLHEDIETMHAELKHWSQFKKQLSREIAKHEKMRIEMDEPLSGKLNEINLQIKERELEIMNARGNILRNELKIKELLIG